MVATVKNASEFRAVTACGDRNPLFRPNVYICTKSNGLIGERIARIDQLGQSAKLRLCR